MKLHDYGCTLKAMRKDIAKGLRLYGEMHRFIPAIAYERGAQVAELKVNHRPRLRGASKYGITRTLRVVLDLMTVKFLSSYATRPAHVFGPIGVISGLTGFVFALYLTVQKFLYDVRYRQPAVALAGDFADLYRISVRYDGVAGRNAGANLP